MLLNEPNYEVLFMPCRLPDMVLCLFGFFESPVMSCVCMGWWCGLCLYAKDLLLALHDFTPWNLFIYFFDFFLQFLFLLFLNTLQFVTGASLLFVLPQSSIAQFYYNITLLPKPGTRALSILELVKPYGKAT